MSATEHLEWCKVRAYPYLDRGDVKGAFLSFVTDMGKHPATQDHPGLRIGMEMMINDQLKTPEEMRHHIEGYH